MKRQKRKVALLGSLAVLFLAGCGASKSQSAASGSSEQSSTSANSALTKCSIDTDNRSNLGIRMKVYEDGSTGVRNDLIRVKFHKFPTEFTGDGDAIKLWTRTVDNAGNFGPWHTVPFMVERYTTAGLQRSPYKYSDLTWAQMKQLGSYFSISASTANEFMNSVVLIAELPDVNMSKAMTAVTYMASSSPEVTALIPQFAANPRVYAKDHPQALLDIHPLAYLWNNNYSDAQYAYEANQFCF